MSKTIRCFIAVDLPSGIVDELARVIKLLRKNIPEGIRWVPVENIHLTVKFLGDVKVDHIDLIQNAIAKSINFIPPFEISLTKVGAFPNFHRPHVIWMGLDAPAYLAEVVDNINLHTDDIGYPSEMRSFSPHLTLGRVSKTIYPNQMQRICDFLETGEFQIKKTGILTSVVLYRSDLTRTGATYTKLFSETLKNS